MRNIRIFTDEELHGAVHFLTLPTVEYDKDGKAVLL